MNKNRRKFLQNTSLITCGLLLGKQTNAEVNLPNYCSLKSGLGDELNLLGSSGDKDLDRSINLELHHLADSFGVLPGFGFFDEGSSSRANAYAFSQTKIDGTRGTVAFGKYMLARELTRHEWGGLSVAGIMAHEFGHIFQYQSTYYDLLTKGQATHKLLELQADYLAGYYLGLKRLRYGEIDIKAFVDTTYLIGDTYFTSPTHHGTPLERKDTMLAGYKTGLKNVSVAEAAAVGMQFVTNL